MVKLVSLCYVHFTKIKILKSIPGKSGKRNEKSKSTSRFHFPPELWTLKQVGLAGAGPLPSLSRKPTPSPEGAPLLIREAIWAGLCYQFWKVTATSTGAKGVETNANIPF